MNAATYLEYAAAVKFPRFRKGLISVHGIRTTGGWQKDVSITLQTHHILHRPVDLGFLSAKVLFPRTSSEAARRFESAHEELTEHGVRVSAVAHSFGTLALGVSLQHNPELILERAIVYGSILSRDFPWSTFVHRGQLQKVLAEICPRDRAVRLAKLIPGPTGASGCYGFKDTAGGAVHHREYDWTGHTKLGTKRHCEKVWIPFILSGRLP